MAITIDYSASPGTVLNAAYMAGKNKYAREEQAAMLPFVRDRQQFQRQAYLYDLAWQHQQQHMQFQYGMQENQQGFQHGMQQERMGYENERLGTQLGVQDLWRRQDDQTRREAIETKERMAADKWAREHPQETPDPWADGGGQSQQPGKQTGLTAPPGSIGIGVGGPPGVGVAGNVPQQDYAATASLPYNMTPAAYIHPAEPGVPMVAPSLASTGLIPSGQRPLGYQGASPEVRRQQVTSRSAQEAQQRRQRLGYADNPYFQFTGPQSTLSYGGYQ